MRVNPVTRIYTLHSGTDYSASDGTPILAAADGVVTFAGHRGGYGNAILINHTVGGKRYSSLYGHMWDGHLYVKVGDRVIAGQHIADIGSNGRSTGPHLYFEIRPKNDYNQVIDSDKWLADHGAVSIVGASTGPTGCYPPKGVEMTLLGVSPDFSAVSGNTLASVVGALLTIVLIASVASLVTSAISWAYGEASGNHQLASKGKTGAFIALGAVALSGAGVAWINFLIGVGDKI